MTDHDEQGEKPAQPTGSSLDVDVGFHMGRTHRALRQAWERQIADLGLTAPQAAMVRAIGEHPGLGVRELARRLCTDPMNAKRLVDHLEQAGLVASSGDPSHRQRRELAPTPAGHRLAARIGERAAAWRNELARLLGEDDLDHLRRLLLALEEFLDTDDPQTLHQQGPRVDARRHQP